ncbi:TetR/AcrR family transcriptional regulator [Gordonia sp. DT30]|uniref:TetR/AcrR family transcriptional regulator n=1 Tax=unclassified Gordonia (in: high G+C Gram-positive bacteria) TaxID=2657482 RepID=UPI003CEA417A
MGRWKPDARGRLAAAAFALYREQGYEQTSGAQIAARAGMHERSLFRLFGDKREVFFHGMADVAAHLSELIRDAPGEASAIDMVEQAMAAQCGQIQQNPAHARLRAAVVASNADLRERDLAKHEELGDAVGDALRLRGVDDVSARLAVGAGMVAFRVALADWFSADQRTDLVDLFHDTMSRLADEVADRST